MISSLDNRISDMIDALLADDATLCSDCADTIRDDAHDDPAYHLDMMNSFTDSNDYPNDDDMIALPLPRALQSLRTSIIACHNDDCCIES